MQCFKLQTEKILKKALMNQIRCKLTGNMLPANLVLTISVKYSIQKSNS